MPRAGPSRSQRATQPSQSQAGPSQSQRTRRGRHEEDESDEGGAEENAMDEDEEEDEAGQAIGDLVKKSQQLVRLALFNEQKRTPLRRDEISKKILGTKRGSFNTVFSHAQTILRETFGMELVELQTRAATLENVSGVDQDKKKKPNASQANGTADDNGDDNTGRQTVTGMKKKATTQGSKTYILRSTLDSKLINIAASRSHPQVMEEEAAEVRDDEDYGPIINWSRTDQLPLLGILYVILSAILLNEKVLSDMDLKSILKRLRLPVGTQLTLNDQSTRKVITIDEYLSALQRQGFLDRTKIGGVGAAGNKRGRGGPSQSQAHDEGDGTTAFEWRWGPRAIAEVGEMGIGKFVADFLEERIREADAEDEDEEMDERAAQKAHQKREEHAAKRTEALMKGIERAAGGSLSGAL